MRLRGAFAALVLLAASPAAAQWQAEVPILRIGVLAGPNQAYVAVRAEPFRRHLAETLDANVELFAAADYPSLVEAEVNGTIQAAFLSASIYAAASVACGGCIEPLVVPIGPGGEPGYHAVLVAPSGGVVRGLRDLPDHRLAVSPPDSLAGRLLPLRLFAADGLAVDEVALIERASPADALAAMLGGEADAALAWSTLTGSAGTGYDGGALRQMVAAGMLDMNRVVLIWTSPLIPYGPLTIRAGLPDDLKDALRAAMLDLDTNPEALAAIERDYGIGYVAAEPEMFAPLLELAGGGR